MKNLSHIGADGRPDMVDVSAKPDSRRIARAGGRITLDKETIRLVSDNRISKGNVLVTAEIAGIAAAKKTFEMIPLCHNIVLSKVSVRAELTDDGVSVESEIICCGKTGVEMEALTAVSVALLTIYDMCKAVDKKMVIGDIRLLEKQKLAIS